MKLAIRLRIKSPSGKQKTVVLKQDEVTVGRDSACDIKINDPEISRRHAVLKLYSADKLTITDLGSSNGTYLRNSPITQETRIAPGTIVRMGNSFVIVEIQGGFKCESYELNVSKDEFQPLSHFLDRSSGNFDVIEQHLFNCFSDLISSSAGLFNLELLLNRVADALGAENGIVVINPGNNDCERAIRVTRGDTVYYPGNVIDALGESGNCILLPSFATTHCDSALKKIGVGTAISAAMAESGVVRGVLYLDRGIDSPQFTQKELNMLCHLANLCAISISRDVKNVALTRKIQGLETERNKWFGALNTKGEPPVPSQNRKYQQVLFIAMRVGRSDRHAFIYGEAGTGRSLLAQRIHIFSEKSSEPFISLDCHDPPKDRIAEVLFGSEEKEQVSIGLIEQVGNGTLYLQEITAFSKDIQARIAKCLKEGFQIREGGSRKIAIAFRLIVSTNVHPEKLASESAFDPVLLELTYPTIFFTPGLKERCEDIIPLSKHFLRMFLASNRPVPEFSPQAAEVLSRYSWPGNISELKDAMRFVAAVCREREIQIGDLPQRILEQPVSVAPENLDMRFQLDSLEKELILVAMERNKNIVTKAAKALGLSESTLRYRMQRLKINI